MAKVYVFLADGFEDIEALAPIDILRRGGLQVVTVGLNESQMVDSAHGVTMLTNVFIYDVDDFDDADLLVLPGGMPGASNLRDNEFLCDLLVKHVKAGKRVGAICAAPFILGQLGLLKGRHATCYPGFERHFKGAEYTGELVTTDGNITTGKGPGAAMAFGYELLSFFAPASKVKELKAGMMYEEPAK